MNNYTKPYYNFLQMDAHVMEALINRIYIGCSVKSIKPWSFHSEFLDPLYSVPLSQENTVYFATVQSASAVFGYVNGVPIGVQFSNIDKPFIFENISQSGTVQSNATAAVQCYGYEITIENRPNVASIPSSAQPASLFTPLGFFFGYTAASFFGDADDLMGGVIANDNGYVFIAAEMAGAAPYLLAEISGGANPVVSSAAVDASVPGQYVLVLPNVGAVTTYTTLRLYAMVSPDGTGGKFLFGTLAIAGAQVQRGYLVIDTPGFAGDDLGCDFANPGFVNGGNLVDIVQIEMGGRVLEVNGSGVYVADYAIAGYTEDQFTVIPPAGNNAFLPPVDCAGMAPPNFLVHLQNFIFRNVVGDTFIPFADAFAATGEFGAATQPCPAPYLIASA